MNGDASVGAKALKTYTSGCYNLSPTIIGLSAGALGSAIPASRWYLVEVIHWPF
jgi:hypothetical protein